MSADLELSGSPLHRSAPHESGMGHVTGAARYVDDLPEPPGMLHATVAVSSVARGRILRRDVEAARSIPGVEAILLAEDVPGRPTIGPIVHDEPILAKERVCFVGQAIALILAKTPDAARRAAEAVVVTVDVEEPILTIEDAIAADDFLTEPHVIARGDVDAVLDASPVRIQGALQCGGQDHFYLEGQAALVVPEEGNYLVYSSTQHPTEIQREVAGALGLPSAAVVCRVPRMGGGVIALGRGCGQGSVAVGAEWRFTE